MPAPVEVLPGRHGEDRVLRFEGPLTLASLPEIQPLLREDTAGSTILDLARVPYMDSAAVGMLVAFHVSCQRAGRPYAVTAVSDRILKMLTVCRVNRILTIYPTVEDADARL